MNESRRSGYVRGKGGSSGGYDDDNDDDDKKGKGLVQRRGDDNVHARSLPTTHVACIYISVYVPQRLTIPILHNREREAGQPQAKIAEIEIGVKEIDAVGAAVLENPLRLVLLAQGPLHALLGGLRGPDGLAESRAAVLLIAPFLEPDPALVRRVLAPPHVHRVEGRQRRPVQVRRVGVGVPFEARVDPPLHDVHGVAEARGELVPDRVVEVVPELEVEA